MMNLHKAGKQLLVIETADPTDDSVLMTVGSHLGATAWWEYRLPDGSVTEAPGGYWISPVEEGL